MSKLTLSLKTTLSKNIEVPFTIKSYIVTVSRTVRPPSISAEPVTRNLSNLPSDTVSETLEADYEA